MGAEVRLDPAGFGIGFKDSWRQALEDVEARGGTPYAIPAGASDHPLGGLGFANWACEVEQQERELGVFFDTVIVCAVTGSTQAGMIAGFAGSGPRPRRVIGIDASAKLDETREQVARIARSTAELIGLGRDLRDDEITVLEGWAGDLYGMPVESTLDAIRLTGQLEGMILDPVYEGKSMAGLIDLVRNGDIGPDSTVLYAHLGGQPALNAYSGLFTDDRAGRLTERGYGMFGMRFAADPGPGRGGGGVPRRRAVGGGRRPAAAARAGGAPRPAAELAAAAGVLGGGGAGGRAVLVIPDGRLPIPPGGGLLVTPSYVGQPASDEADRSRGAAAPAARAQRPQLDAQRQLGDRRLRRARPARAVTPRSTPRGTASRSARPSRSTPRSRIVGAVRQRQRPGPARASTPTRWRPSTPSSCPRRTGNTGKRPWEDLCGGAYFYLDERTGRSSARPGA